MCGRFSPGPTLFTNTYFHKSLTHNLEIVGKRLTVFDLDTVFYGGIMITGSVCRVDHFEVCVQSLRSLRRIFSLLQNYVFSRSRYAA